MFRINYDQPQDVDRRPDLSHFPSSNLLVFCDSLPKTRTHLLPRFLEDHGVDLCRVRAKGVGCRKFGYRKWACWYQKDGDCGSLTNLILCS